MSMKPLGGIPPASLGPAEARKISLLFLAFTVPFGFLVQTRLLSKIGRGRGQGGWVVVRLRPFNIFDYIIGFPGS